jgi:hypothetical protein
MSTQNRVPISLIALLGAAILLPSAPVNAGDAGAFIGGAVAGQVLGQTRRNKKAIEAQQTQQAYSSARAAQPVQQAAPASSSQSVEQKLAELDKLAAGGYITPEEYKAKRQAILDSF